MAASEVEEVTALLSVVPQLYPAGDAWLRRRLADILEGSAQCSVVKRGGRLVAAAILTPKGQEVVKLSTFFVAPEARNSGVGSRLLDALLADLDQANVKETYVTVAHHLAVPLMGLFVPRGFTPCAIEMDRYGEGRHEVVLTRLNA